ncbi:MAG: nicotinate-nucleotide adenylyltransferase [Candidatus Poribacteria bacterium]
MKIAIMGGTFNPIHYAHLLSAEQVRDGLGYDRILFIPSARPPHRDSHGIIHPEHRYQMTLLATADNPCFEVSRIELDRTGPSYAIQTIKELQMFYGEKSELAWIIGADSLIEFKIWKGFDELLDICHFIATTRPNYSLDDVPPDLRERVQFFSITGVDISATEIREHLRLGHSIRYLLPQSVAEYIECHQLYK